MTEEKINLEGLTKEELKELVGYCTRIFAPCLTRSQKPWVK
jgi:hypothetical protein